MSSTVSVAMSAMCRSGFIITAGSQISRPAAGGPLPLAPGPSAIDSDDCMGVGNRSQSTADLPAALALWSSTSSFTCARLLPLSASGTFGEHAHKTHTFNGPFSGTTQVSW